MIFAAIKRAIRRRSPEFRERLEERRRIARHREIWTAIREYDRTHAAGKHRVRGIRRMAQRAGF